MSDGMTFTKEVNSVEEMQAAIFKAIDATLETLRKTELHSGAIHFEYKGAKLTIEIET